MKTHQNKVIRVALSAVVLLLLPFLGFMLGNALSLAYSEGTFVNWHSLGKPDRTITNIIGGNPWTVWLEANDGQIYEGAIQECTSLVAGCWKESESIDTYYPSERGSECKSGFKNIKSPPVGVIKCFSVIDLGAEWYGETHYVLLMDGSVWYWKHSTSGLGPFGLIGIHGDMLCGGVFIGLFTGLLIIFKIIRKPKKILGTQP
jgi:hypothetical protein